MANKTNVIFDIDDNLFVKSNTDGLYVFPWKLLHDGYEVTRQDTVTRVDPDSGVPITHSRFTAGGRIISSRVFVDDEVTFWFWMARATKNTALPCWIYDPKLKGFMRATFLQQPTLSPAGTSVKGMYVQIKFYAQSNAIPIKKFVTENMPARVVTEGNNIVIHDNEEVMY